MVHGINYFASEVGKIRAVAINRGWTPPPESETQIFIRSGDDPREIDVDVWASVLNHIETHHQIPLTISGGGYGCFAVAATSELKNAPRLTRAVETDKELQRLLDRIRARFVEVWRYFGGKSELELLNPRRSYRCIIATNRKPKAVLRVGDKISLGSFSQEDSDLTLGEVSLWVYDPRQAESPTGVGKRLWRKFVGPPSAIHQIEYSDVSVIAPTDIHHVAAQLQPDRQSPNFNLYIHGYGTPIHDAVNAYGHFIHKTRFDQISTIPVLFIWPSRGKIIPYLKDTDTAQVSEAALTQLIDLLSTARTSTIDILAHSHGTKLAMRSLITPSDSANRAQAASIRNLIFVAPDIANGFFNARFVNAKKRARHITVYFSRGDAALTVAGWFQTARLGKIPDLPKAAVEDTDFVDASSLNSDWLGHSYHICCAEMHEDIRGLLDGVPAQKRRLLVQQGGDARMWRLLPEITI
jgi:esterase/lipase superfamily enzyme